MKTNTSGTKYFPINLQKKSMMYSGSQPQIGFNPPIKTLNNSNLQNNLNYKEIKNKYKIKNNATNSKYTPDKIYNNSLSNQYINGKNKKTLNASQSKQIVTKYPNIIDDKNSRNILNSSHNQNLINSSFNRFNKHDNNVNVEKSQNKLNNKNNVYNYNQLNNGGCDVKRSSACYNINNNISSSYNNNNMVDIKNNVNINNYILKKKVINNSEYSNKVRDISYENHRYIDIINNNINNNNNKENITNVKRPYSKLSNQKNNKISNVLGLNTGELIISKNFNNNDYRIDKDKQKIPVKQSYMSNSSSAYNLNIQNKSKIPIKYSSKNVLNIDKSTCYDNKIKDKNTFNKTRTKVNNNPNILNNKASNTLKLSASTNNFLTTSKPITSYENSYNNNCNGNYYFNNSINNYHNDTNYNATQTNSFKSIIKEVNNFSNKIKSIKDLPKPELGAVNNAGIISKKAVRHTHHKSLSENANVEGYNQNSEVMLGYVISKKTDISESLKDEENLGNNLDLKEIQNIKNCLLISTLFLSLDDNLDQLYIEKKLNNLMLKVLALKSEHFECFKKNSKLSLNKVFNRLLKYISLLVLLIKFGILEFLLNNMLQKKIKVVLKVINNCLFDFVDSSVVYKLNKINSLNNGNGNNNEFNKIENINLPKDLQDLLAIFNQLHKKFQTKSLNTWTFEYQIKLYENKILNQIKIFLDELFSENYYVSFYSSITQLISKIHNLSLDRLVFIINETYFTSLKIKTINNPFDFLAPGKNPNNQLITTSYPNKPSSKNLTLVLDLDETLIHFSYSPSGGSFIVRPFCFEFLKSLAPYYEIIIFTAATQEYANRVINLLDKDGKLVSYRLYRQHTTMINGELVKDLSKINRDVKKTLIIDNIPKNFKLQPLNGLEIKTWSGDILDTHLFDLQKLLITLSSLKFDDIRTVVKSIKVQLGNYQNNNPNYRKINI